MRTEHDYEVIFRMWYRNRWTGKIVRSKDGKPIPIKIRHKK